jgi:hypothetical protein
MLPQVLGEYELPLMCTTGKDQQPRPSDAEKLPSFFAPSIIICEKTDNVEASFLLRFVDHGGEPQRHGLAILVPCIYTDVVDENALRTVRQ